MKIDVLDDNRDQYTVLALVDPLAAIALPRIDFQDVQLSNFVPETQGSSRYRESSVGESSPYVVPGSPLGELELDTYSKEAEHHQKMGRKC